MSGWMKRRLDKQQVIKILKVFGRVIMIILAIGITVFGMVGVYLLIADFYYHYGN